MPTLSEPVLIGIAAVGLYFFWRFCRLVVQWGYFVAFFLMGAIAAYIYMPKAPTGASIAFGVLFASTVSAIRTKIMKLIGGAAVVAATAVVGPKLVAQKAEFEKKEKPPIVKSQPGKSPKSVKKPKTD